MVLLLHRPRVLVGAVRGGDVSAHLPSTDSRPIGTHPVHPIRTAGDRLHLVLEAREADVRDRRTGRLRLDSLLPLVFHARADLASTSHVRAAAVRALVVGVLMSAGCPIP